MKCFEPPCIICLKVATQDKKYFEFLNFVFVNGKKIFLSFLPCRYFMDSQPSKLWTFCIFQIEKYKMSQNYQNEAHRTFCIFPNSKIQNAIREFNQKGVTFCIIVMLLILYITLTHYIMVTFLDRKVGFYLIRNFEISLRSYLYQLFSKHDFNS
jgi:hypothetical protein